MKLLTEKDFKEAAAIIGCDVATIKAVADVESAGSGFLPDGSPKILFEGHIFHRYTNGRFSKNPDLADISYPKWTRKHYLGGIREYERFKRAKELDAVAAIQSCSWGKFQIMGFNHARCGYDDIFEFYFMMGTTEGAHLRAFVNFVKSIGADDELRRKDWVAFAQLYNGPQYYKNKYDLKLARAYRKNAAQQR